MTDEEIYEVIHSLTEEQKINLLDWLLVLRDTKEDEPSVTV